METNRHRRSSILLVLICLAASALACTRDDVLAGVDIPNLIVTKTADSDDGACTKSDCSLREAVLAANAAPDEDVIYVPAGVYVLTLHGGPDVHLGSLDLDGDVIIIGEHDDTTIVDGDAADRVFRPRARWASTSAVSRVRRERAVISVPTNSRSARR